MELLYEPEHGNEILKTLDELKRKFSLLKNYIIKTINFIKKSYEIVSCLLKTILKFDSDNSNI